VSTPANPRMDQLAERLKDFRRLREFIDLYARDGALRIAEIPEPDRTEAREILDRVGELDSSRQAERQKLLADMALVETYLDDLAAKPGHAQEVDRLQREYRELRAKITGLPADPGNG
jgi:uncharacterized coiled-coil DUF342 family protein